MKVKDGGASTDTIHVDTEKRADILHAAFKHYFDVALDHHTKAATTSHILLLIVAALIALLELEQTSTLGDTGVGLAVLAVGFFGVLWVRKQHERYTYWRHIACQYQQELTKLVQEFQTEESYDAGARKAVAADGYAVVSRIRDRHLWVILHWIVAAIGLVLFGVSVYP